MAEFKFIVNGELVTYDKYEDIPETFEHVIKFLPDIIEPPHTQEDHDELAKWNDRLQKLMEKERARSN
jgi:hypothetical protein